MVSIIVDLNGVDADGLDLTTTFDWSAASDVYLFPDLAISYAGKGAAQMVLSALHFTLSNAGPGDALSLDAAATVIAKAHHIALSFDSVSGTGSLTWDGTGSPTLDDWQTLVEGVTYSSGTATTQSAPRVLKFTSADAAQAKFSSMASGTEAINVTCFYPGTLIATPEGERPVESLVPGMHVLAPGGEALEILWIGRQTVSSNTRNWRRVLPIRVKAGALGEGIPRRDLLVSPEHALLLGGVLLQAGALVNGSTIVRERNVPRRYTYYHIEVARHALLIAEGALAESFVDNVTRIRFDNWADHCALTRTEPRMIELPYPRAKSARQVPAHVRRQLFWRARALAVADLGTEAIDRPALHTKARRLLDQLCETCGRVMSFGRRTRLFPDPSRSSRVRLHIPPRIWTW